MNTVKTRFENLAAGGDAVGRDENGRAIFAPRAAPGDLAEITLTRERKSFASGQLLHVLEPSSQRTPPPCPYFDSGDIATSCGGCAWQHIEQEPQLQAKREIVRDALLRIGGISDAQQRVAACLPSPRNFHYRNKADFVVARKGSGFEIGFFAPNSHDLVDIETCAIQQPVNNALLTALGEALQAGLVEPFDAASGQGVLRRFVTRAASNGDALACAVTTGARWPRQGEFATFLRERVPELAGVLRREPKNQARLIHDGGNAARDWLEEEVAGMRLKVHGEGFFQVNTSLVPVLLQTALGLAEIQPGERALDLFCGVGLFSLGLARRGAKVTGIERSKQAISDARNNALSNDLEARFIDGDSTAVLRRLRVKEAAQFDCVLIDPPRAGAAEAIPEIVQLGASRIVYVSCDPATLARDAKLLAEGGYHLAKAVPLDLFPQTSHVETVALFDHTHYRE